LLEFGKKPLKRKSENGGEKEKMNAKYKKSLKIVTLVITAVLIATASAQVYSYMYIHGGATITGSELEWILGENAPTGASISGYNVNDLNFSVPENTFKNFTDAVELINNNATSITFDLAADITGGSTSDFTTLDLVVYDSTGAREGDLDVLTEDTATGIVIASLETLYIRFEIDPLTDATTGDVTFTITLTYS
jgi:hypothetical protein